MSKPKVNILTETLVKWLKTFDKEKPLVPLTSTQQLTDGVHLLHIMAIIENLPVDQKTIFKVKDAKDRLNNLDLLYRHIRLFYSVTLHQVVMLTPPNLIALSQDPILQHHREDCLTLLLLLLGCATQCHRRQEFIENMQKLSEDIQEDMMGCFKKLSENSMSADEDKLDLDDTMRTMYHHVCRLVVERDAITEQLIASHLNQFNGIIPESKSPASQQIIADLNQTKEKLNSLLTELDDKSEKINQLKQQLDAKSAEVTKLKSVKPSNERNAGSESNLKDLLNKAEDRARQAEKAEGEVYKLRQQLNEMEFYRSRVQELREDNSGLIEEKQRLEDLLATSRRKEEDVIERLVECQLKYDELQSERIADRHRIEELLATNTALESDQRRKRVDGNQYEGQQKETVTKETMHKMAGLEREVEALKTRLIEAQKQGDQKEEKWKFLEVQKEKMEIRRDLTKASKEAEKTQNRVGELEAILSAVRREKDELSEEMVTMRGAQEEHTKELETKIKELTRQVVLLRRKGAKLSSAQFRDLEVSEMENMFNAVQVLTTQVARLKTNNRILRQTCDKLKRDVDKIMTMELENERLKRENRELRQSLASRTTTTDQNDDVARKNLQLEIENKKLRRIIESLRLTLVQIDPYNRANYHYITSI